MHGTRTGDRPNDVKEILPGLLLLQVRPDLCVPAPRRADLLFRHPNA